MDKIDDNNYQLEDNIYLKKDGKIWSIYYPIKKDINKPFTFENIHWFNFLTGGSIKRVVWLGIMLLLLFFVAWSYQHDLDACYSLMEEQPNYIVSKLGFYNESIKGENSLLIPPQDIITQEPE